MYLTVWIYIEWSWDTVNYDSFSHFRYGNWSWSCRQFGNIVIQTFWWLRTYYTDFFARGYFLNNLTVWICSKSVSNTFNCLGGFFRLLTPDIFIKALGLTWAWSTNLSFCWKFNSLTTDIGTESSCHAIDHTCGCLALRFSYVIIEAFWLRRARYADDSSKL